MSLLDLPDDLVAIILGLLGNADVFALRATSKQMLDCVDRVGPAVLEPAWRNFRFQPNCWVSLIPTEREILRISDDGESVCSVEGNSRVYVPFDMVTGTYVWEVDLLPRAPVWLGVCAPGSQPGSGPRWTFSSERIWLPFVPGRAGLMERSYGVADRVRFRLDATRGVFTMTVFPFAGWRSGNIDLDHLGARFARGRLERVRQARGDRDDPTDPYGVLQSPFGPDDPDLAPFRVQITGVKPPVRFFLDCSLKNNGLVLRSPWKLARFGGQKA